MFRAWIIAAFVLIAATPAAAQTPAYRSYTEDFDRFATETAAMPAPERLKAFHTRFDALVPGFYVPRFGQTQERYVERIVQALTEYPANRDKIRAAAAGFDAAYRSGQTRFLRFFPDYKLTVPVILVHSIGEMDGGTRTINGVTTAVFGADVIARVHDAHTIGPFLDHELFHFHHRRFFTQKCEELWCQLWREGLAVYVASRMNPGADDAQLALNQPRLIRPEVEPHLAEAMCYTRARYETTDDATYASFFFGNGKSPYPPRFGYYIGYLIAQRIGEGRTLDALAKMQADEVKPLITKALDSYSCPAAAS